MRDAHRILYGDWTFKEIVAERLGNLLANLEEAERFGKKGSEDSACGCFTMMHGGALPEDEEPEQFLEDECVELNFG
jgi:hypothetical protein